MHPWVGSNHQIWAQLTQAYHLFWQPPAITILRMCTFQFMYTTIKALEGLVSTVCACTDIPLFVGHWNFHKIYSVTLTQVQSLSLTVLCGNNDKKAIKGLNFGHSKWTLRHVNDKIFPFDVHQLPQTRRCRLLRSKWWQFWFQNYPNMPHREHNYTCSVTFQQVNWNTLSV